MHSLKAPGLALGLAAAAFLSLETTLAEDTKLLDYPVNAAGVVEGSTSDVMTETVVEGGDPEANGTDPRDMTAKFMPYARYNKLDNDLESYEGVLFGLVPIKIGERFFDQPDYKWGLTFEFPVAKYVDASAPIDAAGRKIRALAGGSRIGRGQGLTTPIPSGRPKDNAFGAGDLNMRLLIPFYQGQIGKMPVAALTGFEHWFPTASDDLLGSGKWQIAPHLTVVFDLAPDKGIFLASMNFWRTSYAGDSDRDDIELYIGRHFLNIPIGQSGYYMLAEFQTIADLRKGGWETWVGPEFGKVLKPGRILYAKPGFGVNVEPNQRTWSFELGYRYFF